jgi:SAM-dependent MidA family methyltransferase
MGSPLLSVILERIRAHGPVSVEEYVDLALYHPELGYYSRADQRSGRAGDFVTSVDLGPVFGGLLACQFAEMWRLTAARGDDEVPFDLVEAAAGSGRLSRDVLDWAASEDRAFYDATRLHLVERSPAARARQADVLGAHAGRLASSAADLPESVTGVIFANELLDALPPHLVVMRADGLREVFVDAAGDRLVTREAAPSSDRLAAYLEEVGARLEPGWFAEINLAAVDWVRAAAARLRRGFLVLVDYGHEARELFSATHAAGTLTTYRRHASEDRAEGPGWLSGPGDRDITSHVDLTAVQLAARDAGLERVALLDQGYFLLGLGLADRWPADGGEAPDAIRRRLALKTLLLPGGMGSTHKVMIFGRDVGTPALRGTSTGGRLTA